METDFIYMLVSNYSPKSEWLKNYLVFLHVIFRVPKDGEYLRTYFGQDIHTSSKSFCIVSCKVFNPINLLKISQPLKNWGPFKTGPGDGMLKIKIRLI